jgi:hypothetical protein
MIVLMMRLGRVSFRRRVVRGRCWLLWIAVGRVHAHVLHPWRHARRHPMHSWGHPVGGAIRRVVAHWRAIRHHGPLRRCVAHGVAVAATSSWRLAVLAMLAVRGLRGVSRIAAKVALAVTARRSAALGKRIRSVGCEGILLAIVRIVAMEAIGHQLSSGRCSTTAVGVEVRVGHYGRLITVGHMLLGDVIPLRARVVRRHRRSPTRWCIARVVVRILEAVLVGGWRPLPPAARAAMFGQRASAAAAVAGGRVGNGHSVARSRASGGFVSRGRRGGSSRGVGVVLYLGARGRVGWLDLLVVDEVPAGFVFFVSLVLLAVLVVGLVGRILLRANLNTRAVFVAV